MMLWFIQSAAYLALAGVATLVSRKHSIRLVGLSLIAMSAASSIGFFAAPFVLRPSIEILTMWVSCVIAALLLIGDRDRQRLYQAILLLGLADFGFCGALFFQIALYDEPTKTLRHLFDFSVNVIFIGQCLCVAFPGAQDVYRRWIAAIDGRRAMDGEEAAQLACIERLDRK